MGNALFNQAVMERILERSRKNVPKRNPRENLLIQHVEDCQEKYPGLFPIGYGILNVLVHGHLGYGNGYSWIDGKLQLSCNNQEDKPFVEIGNDLNRVASGANWDDQIGQVLSIGDFSGLTKLPLISGGKYSRIFQTPKDVNVDHFAGMIFAVQQYAYHEFTGDYAKSEKEMTEACKRFLAMMLHTVFKDRVDEVQESLREIYAVVIAQLKRVYAAHVFYDHVVDLVEDQINGPLGDRLRALHERKCEEFIYYL